MTRKFPTPLGKSTLQNWGNSTCKKQSRPAPEPTVEEKNYLRRKRADQRAGKFGNLPVKVFQYSFPDEEPIYSCGREMHEDAFKNEIQSFSWEWKCRLGTGRSEDT